MNAPTFLVSALLRLHGDLLGEHEADLHARAAVEAERLVGRPEITAELLLGMAWVESRYEPVLASYGRVGGGRRTNWRSRRRPPASRPAYFCGVLQLRGDSWRRCLRRMDDVRGAYWHAADELVFWLDNRRCRRRAPDRRLRCALLGYGGGAPLIRRWRYPYPSRVMKRAEEIRVERSRLREEAPVPSVTRGEA